MVWTAPSKRYHNAATTVAEHCSTDYSKLASAATISHSISNASSQWLSLRLRNLVDLSLMRLLQKRSALLLAPYIRLHDLLSRLWETLYQDGTYPNMVKPLELAD